MNVIAMIAEQRIQQAMQDKEFCPPQWKNRRLELDDDRFIPDDLKMAYKLLKNSGFLPPEIEERKQVHRLEELIAATEDENERLRQMQKLNVLLMKIDAKRPTASNIANQEDYYRQVVERISVSKKKGTR